MMNNSEFDYLPGLRKSVFKDTNKILSRNTIDFSKAEYWVCTQSMTVKNLKIQISGDYAFQAGASLPTSEKLATFLNLTNIPTGALSYDTSGDKSITYTEGRSQGLVATLY